MISKAAKIRLGVFVTAALLLMAVFIGVVAGNRLMPKRDMYYIRFKDYSVSGLQLGGAVNYRGIQVGKVDKIAIDPKDVTSVIVTVSVDHGTPIKADNEAVLVYIGITGIKAVEIQGGTNESALLKPKSFIKSGSTELDEISGKALTIVDKIDQIASNLNSITNQENQRNISEILSQTSSLLSETRAQLGSTVQSLNKLAQSTTGITDGLGTNLTKITENLTRNLDSLSTVAAANLDRIGDSSATSLADLSQSTKASLERLTDDLETQFASISDNLNNSISEISASTQSLLADTRAQINNVGQHSDALVLQTTRDVADMSLKINQSLDRVNNLLASSELEKLLLNLNELSAKLNEANVKGLAEELSLTVSKAGNLINNVDRVLIRNRANLNDIIESLREASENLNEFSRQISDNPNLILLPK